MEAQQFTPPARPRIFVADDCRDAADALVQLLSLMGYEATAAYNGREVVEACASAHPTLAILDVEMPELDGCDAARLIKAAPGPRPWIASLSGAALDSEPLRSRYRVFDSALTKPAEFDELAALLQDKSGPPSAPAAIFCLGNARARPATASQAISAMAASNDSSLFRAQTFH